MSWKTEGVKRQPVYYQLQTAATTCVLVIYCEVTHYPEINGFKQYVLARCSGSRL